MRMTQEQFDHVLKKQKSFASVFDKSIPVTKPKKRNKYNAQIRLLDNFIFASISESVYYEECKLRVKSGELLYFLRQVPIHLPGGVKYVVDFLLMYADGRVEFVDVKGGKVTETFRIKQRMVEALYPIKIRIAKRIGKNGKFELHGTI